MPLRLATSWDWHGAVIRHTTKKMLMLRCGPAIRACSSAAHQLLERRRRARGWHGSRGADGVGKQSSAICETLAAPAARLGRATLVAQPSLWGAPLRVAPAAASATVQSTGRPTAALSGCSSLSVWHPASGPDVRAAADQPSQKPPGGQNPFSPCLKASYRNSGHGAAAAARRAAAPARPGRTMQGRRPSQQHSSWCPWRCRGGPAGGLPSRREGPRPDRQRNSHSAGHGEPDDRSAVPGGPLLSCPAPKALLRAPAVPML